MKSGHGLVLCNVGMGSPSIFAGIVEMLRESNYVIQAFLFMLMILVSGKCFCSDGVTTILT